MQTTGEIDVDELVVMKDDSYGSEVDVDSFAVTGGFISRAAAGASPSSPPSPAAARAEGVTFGANQPTGDVIMEEYFQDEEDIVILPQEDEIVISPHHDPYHPQVGGSNERYIEMVGINNNTTTSDFVTLPREELEALINTKEALIDTNHRVAALEGMVNSLLRNNNGGRGQKTQYHQALEQAAAKPPHHHQNYNHGGVAASTDLTEFLEVGEPQQEKGGNTRESSIFLPTKEEWQESYGESIYTLLYLCSVKSQCFWYGMFVYFLQIGTISLAIADALDRENKNNPLQIPAMVGLEVTYAQGGIIFMLFAYQSDVIEAVLKLGDGWYPLYDYPGSTFPTWLFSCLAQLSAGLLVLLGCFLLTMQASTVIDLMLNLTALLFISEIDDLGFYMAKMGFITSELEFQTNGMVGIKVPKKKSRKSYRRALCILTMVGLFVGYGIIKNRQLSGHYLYTNIYVQFGDAYNPKIPHYSGILSATSFRTTKRRQYRDTGTSNILLAYCKAENAWTFSEESATPCEGFFAKSYETKSYDVTSIPDSEWQVLDSNGRLQPFDSFSLVERDCHPKICQGVCQADGLCQCDHDQFGLDCEFSDVCHEIVIDDRFPSFPQVLTPSLADPKKLEPTPFMSKSFQRLQNDNTKEYLRIYNMPVFYSNTTFPANVMFFGGRRWILTTEHVLFDLTEAKKEYPNRWYFPEKTIAVLENGFHAHHQATYIPFFISDPVDFETPDFLPTPVGLHWWIVESTNDTLRHFVPDMPVKTVFLCQLPPLSCLHQPESFCGTTGECNKDTGLCDCYDKSNHYGDRCELVTPCYKQDDPCNGHGICDEMSGVCQCHPPWHGDGCLTWYSCHEKEGTCLSGGECDTGTGQCACPMDPAITGKACELSGSCLSLGCANGGLCGPNGQCVCRPPYYGENCNLIDKTQQEFFCFKDEDCENGTCDLGTGLCDCANPNSYGPFCEHTFDCSQPAFWGSHDGYVPCLNSGICNESSGVCECPEPYFGPDCSQVPRCVNDEDCGDGKCDIDSGLCQCTSGRAAGLRCENEIRCRSSEDCYGTGSFCYHNTCQCESGLGGYKCESVIVGVWPSHHGELLQLLKESAKLCGYEDPACCSRNDTGIPFLKEKVGC